MAATTRQFKCSGCSSILAIEDIHRHKKTKEPYCVECNIKHIPYELTPITPKPKPKRIHNPNHADYYRQ